jgi:hypothetical protein
MSTRLVKLPAGTASNVPFICSLGSGEPQVLQKDLLCRVFGKSKRRTFPSPEIHLSVALDENRFAA